MCYANSPPCGEAGGLFSRPGHCSRRTTVEIRHPRMGFPLLRLENPFEIEPAKTAETLTFSMANSAV